MAALAACRTPELSPEQLLELNPSGWLIGLEPYELARVAPLYYGDLEPDVHNRQAHRLGSMLLAERYGYTVAFALGVANELWEAFMLGYTGEPFLSEMRFGLGDLAANCRGLQDAFFREPAFRVLLLLRGRGGRDVR